MMEKVFKTCLGIQGSVMGWDDPWHSEACKKYMRTGERMPFSSQDGRPSPEAFIRFIKSLGVDFYVHQALPETDEINGFIASMKEFGVPYLLGNEYGSINKNCGDKTNRYDIHESCVEKAKSSELFLGLLYDETEHLQLHPEIYAKNQAEDCKGRPAVHQWASTINKSLPEIENDVCEAVRERVEAYGGDVPLYSEQVFPVMYHTLARGGMNPCPKIMKEEFQSLQLSTALGAAKQYKRKMGICADLWGPDVGGWFTRLWGFPGHSPREFKSALEMAYLMGPDFLFTENIDPLAVHNKDGFAKTEFGDVFEEFIKKFIPENPRCYDHAMVDPDILIIRSDDADINIEGGFFGRGLYGSMELKSDHKSSSVFKIFNVISRDRIPANGNTFWLPQYVYHAASFDRTRETLKTLPLENGVGKEKETCTHKLFYPLNNVAVYDEKVDDTTLGQPKLIFLAGSRISDGCLKAVANRVRSGAVCIAAKWLLPEGCDYSRNDGEGRWIVAEDFLCHEVKEAAQHFMGDADCWMQRFGNYEVRFYNENNDGITLEHEVVRFAF